MGAAGVLGLRLRSAASATRLCFHSGGLLDDLLIERQAEQPAPALNPELEALLSF